MKEIRVWDYAVRCYHWSQLLLLLVLWLTAETGAMEWHQLTAYSLAALLIARLIWGVIGSETARFSHFLMKPLQAIRHWNKAKQGVGHKGLSAYMALALMGLVLLQFVSGLMTSDDVFVEGPLYNLVPADWASLAGWWHHLGFKLILAAAAVHILAALWHGWRRDGTLGAMVHGKVAADVAQPAERSFWWYLLLVLMIWLGFIWWQSPLLQTLLG